MVDGKDKQAPSTRSEISKRPSWKSYHEIFLHSLRGSAKALVLALGVKGSISFFLACIRILPMAAKKGTSSGSKILSAFKQAFGGIDNLRFASAITLFTFLWKLGNNSLMHYYKRDSPSKRFGAIAGFVAGLCAICCETEENRVGYAQQFSVRALQSFVNARKMRNLPTVKNGDAWAFVGSCSWILYAFCFRPDTLPRVYLKWLTDRAGIPETCLDLHKAHATNAYQLTTKVEGVLSTVGVSESNLSILHDSLKMSGGKLQEFPCLFFHPLADRCVIHCAKLFTRNIKEMAPVYFSLTFIPMAIFTPTKLITHTWQQLRRIMEATATSSIFIASLITCLQTGLCLYCNIVPTWKTKHFIIPLTMISSLTIFIEQKKKRAELAMFVFPKAIQSLYLTMIDKKYLISLPGLEVVSFAGALSVIMSLYQTEPQDISSLLYKIMLQVIGEY